MQSTLLWLHVASPSVCPSVTLVGQDHIGWKSWILTAQTINPTPSVFIAQRPSTYSQGIMGKFWGDLSWGGKVAGWSTKVAISMKRAKIEEKLLWRAHRNSPTLSWTVPSPTHYGFLFPKIGFATPPKTSIAIVSGNHKAIDFKFGWYIHRVHLNKSPLKILEKRGRGRIQGLPNVLKYSLLSQERVKEWTLNFVRTLQQNRSEQKPITNFGKSSRNCENYSGHPYI